MVAFNFSFEDRIIRSDGPYNLYEIVNCNDLKVRIALPFVFTTRFYLALRSLIHRRAGVESWNKTTPGDHDFVTRVVAMRIDSHRVYEL